MVFLHIFLIQKVYIELALKKDSIRWQRTVTMQLCVLFPLDLFLKVDDESTTQRLWNFIALCKVKKTREISQWDLSSAAAMDGNFSNDDGGFMRLVA